MKNKESIVPRFEWLIAAQKARMKWLESKIKTAEQEIDKLGTKLQTKNEGLKENTEIIMELILDRDYYKNKSKQLEDTIKKINKKREL